jgi:hypothetical protein
MSKKIAGWADVEFAGRRVTLNFEVEFDLSPERSEAEERGHGEYAMKQRAKSVAALKEGAGHVGMGQWGNEVRYQHQNQEHEARAKALELLGLKTFQRVDTEEEFSAFVERSETLQGSTVCVVLD